MRLSKNFTLYELCKSNTGSRMGIDNSPSPEIINNLQLLVIKILQPLRNQLGPIRVNSGYRSPALNRAIKGSKNSAHKRGEASDIIIVRDGKTDNKLIFDSVIELNLDFDQMIWEFGGKWIHISYVKDNNRKQILEAYKDDNNKTKYKPYPTKYKSL